MVHVPQATMMQAIERYMKQAIVDRNPAVSSAALISSLVGLLTVRCGAVMNGCEECDCFVQHLCERGSGEIVKRWVNEAQEALSSDNVMVQYHAMGVLYHIRKRDKYVVHRDPKLQGHGI